MSLVDRYGDPISSASFIKAAQNGGGRMPAVPLRPLEPLRKLVRQRDWQTISYISDRLFANFPLVEGAICQKSMYAVGNAWTPVFMGEDEEWGKEARRWLIEEWYPSCDVRGLNYDFVTNLYQTSIAIDAAGDSIELLTESPNGWPQIQMIPCRQIGNWDSYSEKVDKGQYAGATIRNGVIMDRTGRPIAYRKLGEERGDFEDIPAENIIHTMEPKWIDQARGFPIFTSCLEDLGMSNQSEEWEQQAMLIASAIGLLETNENGEAPTSEESEFNVQSQSGVPESTPAGINIQTLMGGMIRYMRANAGMKVEQFVTAKPGADWEMYQDRVARKAMTAANWSYSMVWKPDGTNGTVQRSELNKCKMSVSDRQSLLSPRARRKIGYAISKAMRPVKDGGIGAIPPYPGKDKGGFLKWGFALPQKISIDEGRDRAQRREDSKAGLILDSTIVEEEGYTTYVDFCRARWRDVAIMEIERQAAEKQYGIKLDPRQGKMLTANDQPQGQNGQDGDENSDAESGGGNEAQDIETTKMRMDAYGVGVRAGAITPNDEDEADFRARLGLPAMNSNVDKAWTEDGGVRRPITLVGREGGLPGQSAAPNEDPA